MATPQKPLRHREIENDLRRKVIDGVYGVGEMLPGRRDLARQYDVSTLTIERAVDGLVRAGLLRSDDRRGTFVAKKTVEAEPGGGELSIGVVARLFPPQHDQGFGHNDWVRQIIQSIEQEVSNEDHRTVFYNTFGNDGSSAPLAEAVQTCLKDAVNGIIVVAFNFAPDEVAQAQVMLEGVDQPAVFVTSTAVIGTSPQVFPDGVDAGFQAAQHLIRRGCETIAYVSPFRAWWSDERLTGVRAACGRAGLPAVRTYPSHTTEWRDESVTHEGGYRAGVELLRELQPKQGVVVTNDAILLGFLAAASDAGRALGTDFLTVSFDDIPEARTLRLTSLRAPWDAMGREAARLLRDSLGGRNESLQVRLRSRLIPRSSSRWETSG
ncbi:LacI family DNA-binding transcriptional regulator [soil metagenome]